MVPDRCQRLGPLSEMAGFQPSTNGRIWVFTEGVRQLCADYWTAETQRRMVQEGEDRRFGDIEVTVTGRHGPSSWDARVELSRDVPAGKPAVIRTSGDLDLRLGDRLRVLNAALTMDDEDQTQPAVITLGTLSEAYAVP